MDRKFGLIGICLVVLLIGGAASALAQPDRHDEQDEAASAGALAQYRKGERLAKNGQFTEAVAAYRQAIRLEPDYPQAYYEMGLAYAGLNQYPDAVKAFKEAARLQPEMGLIYENLGVVYIKMGQWREARDALATAIRLNPDSPEAHYNLGLANGKLNQDQEARTQFAEAIRLDPAMAKAHKNLGSPTSTWEAWMMPGNPCRKRCGWTPKIPRPITPCASIMPGRATPRLPIGNSRP